MIITKNAPDSVTIDMKTEEIYFLARILIHAKFSSEVRPEVFTHDLLNGMLRRLIDILKESHDPELIIRTDMKFVSDNGAEIDQGTKNILRYIEYNKDKISVDEINDIFFPYVYEASGE